VVEVGGALAGIVIRKDETRSEAKVIKSPGLRILKLCTFIMGPQFRGEKFGEQLLKQCLWFARPTVMMLCMLPCSLARTS
jgi:hypothetical protein